jgi:hypothetical protein
VARETDFLDLYRELDLHPGCGLIEFRQAYRRRLAILHPDRQFGHPDDAPAPGELQQLTALYGAAMEFHRQHGRLPGAATTRPVHVPIANRPAAPAAVEPPRKLPRWLLLLIGTAAAILLLWNTDPSAPPAPAAAPESTTAVESVDSHTGSPARLIELGMSPEAVQAIEGNPFVMNTDRWEYGPSWVRFENHKVVDWYSSALRPLKAMPRHAQP